MDYQKTTKTVNFYLRIYLLTFSISIVLELINSPIKTMTYPWLLIMFSHSIIMINLSKKSRAHKALLLEAFPLLITAGLFYLVVYLEENNYIKTYDVFSYVYIATIILFFIFYFKNFYLNKIFFVILGSLPYIILTIVVIKGIHFDVSDYLLQIIALSVFAPVIYLDKVSWEFKV